MIIYFLFVFKSAIDDFNHNKGRTLLTSLGILIGVLAVVLLMALGLGLKKYIENQFESLGANLVMIIPGGKGTFLQGGGMVGGIKFDEKDLTKIKKIKTIKNITGVYAKPGSKISANGKTEVTELIASNEEISAIMNLEAEEGRLFEKKDIQKGNKIIMIYSPLAEKLFGSTEDVIGEKVTVNKQNYKVVALLKSKGGGGVAGASIDHQAFIPFKASFSFNTDKKYYGIYLKTIDKESVSETKTEIEKTLNKRYDKDDFSVMEEKEIMDTISSIFSIINTVLVAIAAISLIVGGIGIMNIMYVSVTERIKEIGIRRALGARTNDILYQFLIESVLLSVMGGLLGLGLAFLIVFFIQKLFPAYVDVQSVLLALGVSSAIGIIFGVFPAKKAADLSPIDAIRYE
jgi:putative ABC transport system permease protein